MRTACRWIGNPNRRYPIRQARFVLGQTEYILHHRLNRSYSILFVSVYGAYLDKRFMSEHLVYSLANDFQHRLGLCLSLTYGRCQFTELRSGKARLDD